MNETGQINFIDLPIISFIHLFLPQALAERTACLDLPENPESKELPVWMAPTERKVPAETWASKVPLDSQDPEDPLVLPETLEWLVPRVSR